MTDSPGRHVLFLSWRDLRHPEGGGSELFLERIAAELTTQGHQVTLFCQAYAGASRVETMPEGLRIVRRGGRHTVYLFAALVYLMGAVGFGPLGRRGFGRPDVIVDVCNGMPFLSRFYARRRVIALVHHVHREQWSCVFGPLMARVGWWIESRLAIRVYRRCPYITVSESTRRELVGLGVDPERITVVYNGTPPVDGAPVPRTAHPSLVVLGRLVPHKRVELALRATALLAVELPDLELVVAGQGWWDEPLRRLAEDLAITDRVRFTGFVSEAEKHELLCRAWLSLIPSVKEGWGLTIVEAGARGTPSIAFRAAGGVVEAVVDGETGMLVDDEFEFFRSVRALLLDTGLRDRLGAAAVRHAERFTWPAAGAAFAGVVTGRGPATTPHLANQRVP